MPAWIVEVKYAGDEDGGRLARSKMKVHRFEAGARCPGRPTLRIHDRPPGLNGRTAAAKQPMCVTAREHDQVARLHDKALTDIVFDHRASG